MTEIFVTQANLQEWQDLGLIQVVDQYLMFQKEDLTANLQPALYIVELLSEQDVQQWVGKVKSIQALEDLGAEHYFDSLLMGDTAYQVIEGFRGELKSVDENESQKIRRVLKPKSKKKKRDTL